MTSDEGNQQRAHAEIVTMITLAHATRWPELEDEVATILREDDFAPFFMRCLVYSALASLHVIALLTEGSIEEAIQQLGLTLASDDGSSEQPESEN